MTFEPLAVSGKSAAQQRLAGARKLFEDKSYETAALAYHEILADPLLAEGREEARYQLAKCLARLKLNHSALARFEDILGKGPQGTRYFHTALEWLFSVAKKTTNEQVIVSWVARFAGEKFPPAYQDRFNYLLARYHYERGLALTEAGQAAEGKKSYDEARRLAALVRLAPVAPMPAGGEIEEDAGEVEDIHARARFIDGLVRYAQGDPPGALESFKDVIRMTNPRRARRLDPTLREMAFLELARLHYEHRQNRYAIFYYGKMPWGGERWLEGLWESSYAHYRIGDYERALGNLLTLHSPYFKDEYFPESHILKAIIYYENCRYPEARAILEDFGRMYEPVYAELGKITRRGGPAAGYYDLIERTEKDKSIGEGAIMRKVMKIAFGDKTIKRLNDSILEIEAEMDVGIGQRRSAFRQAALAQELLAALKAERTRLVEEAGARARQKLEYERDELRRFLEQALRIKIEVSRKEREALEATLARAGGAELKQYRYSVAVSDEHLYWPYEGEFWRDELGTFSYTLTKGCRQELAQQPGR
jgi:hypothetical protein